MANATVSVPDDAALGDAGATLTLNSGTLLVTGAFDSLRPVVLDGVQDVIDVDDGIVATLNGGVSGSAGLLVSGGGGLVLIGADTYTGDTTVSGAELGVTLDASLGQGSTLTLDGGTLLTTGAGISNSRSIVLASTTSAIDTIDTNSNSDTLSGTISGTGILLVTDGGILSLTGGNTFTGATSVTGGATLAACADANLGDPASTLALTGGTLLATGGFASTRTVVRAGT